MRCVMQCRVWNRVKHSRMVLRDSTAGNTRATTGSGGDRAAAGSAGEVSAAGEADACFMRRRLTGRPAARS